MCENDRYVLATANPGKLLEMRAILSGIGADLISRVDAGAGMDIPETASTFYENALLKATAVCKATGLPAIADDSGLAVRALGGKPGVDSSSFGGEGLSDGDRCAYLLSVMKNVEQRDAKFVCTIVCVFPAGDVLSAEGECSGEILREPRGTAGGFGYDPVFLLKESGRTLAELSPEEKNAVSHRGIALRSFSGKLLERNRKVVTLEDRNIRRDI